MWQGTWAGLRQSLWRTKTVSLTACKEPKPFNNHLRKLGSRSTPVKPEDDHGPSQHLDCNLWQTQSHGTQLHCDSIPDTQRLWNKKWRVKPLSFGVFHYAMIGNKYNEWLLPGSSHWVSSLLSKWEWEQKISQHYTQVWELNVCDPCPQNYSHLNVMEHDMVSFERNKKWVEREFSSSMTPDPTKSKDKSTPQRGRSPFLSTVFLSS